MRLYIRHKLVWVLLPIVVFQIVSVILVYDHVTFGAAADNVIWFGSALPRVLQRFRHISSYYEKIAVSNPLGSLFSFALAACCSWSLLLPDTFLRTYLHITRFTQVDPKINMRHLQTMRICLIIVGSSHWIGCIMYAIARSLGFSSVTWVYDFEKLLPNYHFDESTIEFDYMLCIYKGFNTLSNLSYDIGVPTNLAELCFAFATMLMQVYISALTLGESSICPRKHSFHSQVGV